MRKLVALILASCLASTPAAAVSLASCTVGATPVAYGVYDPTSATPLGSTGTVTASCSLVIGVSLFVAYSIALSPGSGSYTVRTMHSGAAVMNYNLYTTAAYAAVWGDGTAGTSPVSDAYLLGLASTVKNYPIYGRIPALQPVPAGLYSDSIVVTITY